MATIPDEEKIISEADRETMQDEWNRNWYWYNNTGPRRTSSREQKSNEKHGTHQLPSPNPPPVPPPIPTTSPSSKKSPPRLPMVLQEEPVASPTPSICFKHNLPSFQRPKSAAFISQEALNSVIAKGYVESPTWSVPDILADSKLTIQPAIDVEEICNGVVYPITKETITKYEKLINAPALSEVWTKAMCRELGRLA